MMRIDYVRIPGREWVADPDRRFDTVEIRAPLLLATRRAIAAVRDDLPAAFSLPEGESIRTDETVLPMRVLREAIVNAVMHRSYRIHGAIQILRYANRVEIRNPGHSLKAEEQLGEPGSQTRNPRIAAVLHEVHLAETKGSGIRAMRELMRENDLLPPTFESSRRPDQFVVTLLFHHFLGETDIAWLRRVTADRLSDEEARALVFVREVGAIDNATYRSINHAETLNASAHLRRLRDLGVLAMKGSGSRTYYIPGEGFPGRGTAQFPADHQSSADLPQVQADVHQSPADLPQAATDLPQLPTDLPQAVADLPQLPEQELPTALRQRLADLGPRPRRDQLRAVVVALCAWRPLAARELAALIGGRRAKYLVKLHLGAMVDGGQLTYTIPAMPNHPDQKYAVPGLPE